MVGALRRVRRGVCDTPLHACVAATLRGSLFARPLRAGALRHHSTSLTRRAAAEQYGEAPKTLTWNNFTTNMLIFAC